MLRTLLFCLLTTLAVTVYGQSFEMTGLQEGYKGTIGDIVRAPIRFKNISEKPIVLVIRKLHEQIGSTQKNFFCLPWEK